MGDNGEVSYYEFYSYLNGGYKYYHDYNVNILYDITQGIFYDYWTDSVIHYLNDGEYECGGKQGKIFFGSMK